MRTLLDTCTLAETQKPQGDPRVKSAVAQLDDFDLFMSVVTIGEITKGISLLADGKKKSKYHEWLVGLTERYADRILEVDLATATIWGDITARCQTAGTIVPASDGLIAATALRHRIQVMTRNVRNFEIAGVPVTNPWQDS